MMIKLIIVYLKVAVNIPGTPVVSQNEGPQKGSVRQGP